MIPRKDAKTQRRLLVPCSLLLAPFFSLLLLISSQSTTLQSSPAWMLKVDSLVWETAQSSTTTEFLLYLNTQADLSGADALSDKLAKGQFVYEQLTAVAERTQPAVITQLEGMGVKYQPFWVANMIWVEGDETAVSSLAQRNDVAFLYANPKVQLDLLRPDSLPIKNVPNVLGESQSVEWNVSHIDADKVWELGITGEGVVIGGQDTGYDWTHPALQNQYRGWDGVTATHDYNWHDAIHENNPNTADGNPCGFDVNEPCDDHYHGTHTMGTMVGNDLEQSDPNWPAGASNAVGIAPGAKWIACRNMEQGYGTPATYAECYQWFIAPYPYGGDPMVDGDPAKAPHVINNSWGCPPFEGCTDPMVLQNIVDAVRAAGIVTVHSAGNYGSSSCSTIRDPAAIYDSSFTVGNTTFSDSISSSSSIGPVTIDGSNRMKPDIVAPGTGIRATMPNNSYGSLSGTSMAGPHVAGLVALLISAEPSLAGNVDAIEQIIRDTAVPLTTTQNCGTDTPTSVPNNVFGNGRIDAYAAITSGFSESFYLPFVQTP